MLQGSLIDGHTVKVFKPNKAQHDVLLTRALLEQNVPPWFLESTAFKAYVRFISRTHTLLLLDTLFFSN
jgi:hypothetical protein